MIERADIKSELKDLEERIREELMKEWEAQGHVMTGSGISGITYKEAIQPYQFTVEAFSKNYVGILNDGVPAGNIPFSGTTRGRGGNGTGKSLYIEGLTKYAMKRMGAGEKEARSIAFAIAYTHKREGMPSIGSYAFTKTGERTSFVDRVVEKTSGDLEVTVAYIFEKVINVMFETQIQ